MQLPLFHLCFTMLLMQRSCSSSSPRAAGRGRRSSVSNRSCSCFTETCCCLVLELQTWQNSHLGVWPSWLIAGFKYGFVFRHQERATPGKMSCLKWLAPNRNAPCQSCAAYSRYCVLICDPSLRPSATAARLENEHDNLQMTDESLKVCFLVPAARSVGDLRDIFQVWQHAWVFFLSSSDCHGHERRLNKLVLK